MGLPVSTISPSSMKMTLSADLPRETHLVRDDDHGHAVPGQVLHDGEHLADEFRVKRRGGFVEQHQLRMHGQRPGDRDPLLLPAGQLRRVGVRPCP